MNCIYHPTAQAHHHCSHCDQRFCEKCLDEPSVTRNTESTALCFICEAELTHLQSSNSIQPFWSRLGEIYKYPISTQALITILLIAISSAMLQGFGLFSLVPIVAINLYSFSCLRETASGDLEAPGVEASFQGSIAPVLYVGLSMFIAMLLAGAAFNSLGYGMGVISSLVLILIMPAVIILIAIDEQLLAALSPVRFIGVIKTTGASYFVMVLFIIVMLFSVDILGLDLC